MDGSFPKLVDTDYSLDIKREEREIQLPDPPEFMSYEAKCEFLRSIQNLIEEDLYKGPRIGLFELYCVSFGYAKELEQNLAEDGKIVGGKAHPAFKMMLDAMQRAQSLWAEIKPKKIIVKKDEEVEEEEESVWKGSNLLA